MAICKCIARCFYCRVNFETNYYTVVQTLWLLDAKSQLQKNLTDTTGSDQQLVQVQSQSKQTHLKLPNHHRDRATQMTILDPRPRSNPVHA